MEPKCFPVEADGLKPASVEVKMMKGVVRNRKVSMNNQIKHAKKCFNNEIIHKWKRMEMEGQWKPERTDKDKEVSRN